MANLCWEEHESQRVVADLVEMGVLKKKGGLIIFEGADGWQAPGRLGSTTVRARANAGASVPSVPNSPPDPPKTDGGVGGVRNVTYRTSSTELLKDRTERERDVSAAMNKRRSEVLAMDDWVRLAMLLRDVGDLTPDDIARRVIPALKRTRDGKWRQWCERLEYCAVYASHFVKCERIEFRKGKINYLIGMVNRMLAEGQHPVGARSYHAQTKATIEDFDPAAPRELCAIVMEEIRKQAEARQ